VALTEQQTGEIGFWRDLYVTSGHEGFLNIRRGDLLGRTEFFPELLAETGYGLDYGCGLISMFEFSNLKMDAYDPLQAEYEKIVPTVETAQVAYWSERPEPPTLYNFIACFNVADHTPDIPELLGHLRSLLVPGGRLYFEVNFDPELYPTCHHSLWRMDTVREHLTGFDLVRERVRPSDVLEGQELYEGLYIRSAA
jgi:hypothetical protein